MNREGMKLQSGKGKRFEEFASRLDALVFSSFLKNFILSQATIGPFRFPALMGPRRIPRSLVPLSLFQFQPDGVI